MKAFAVATLLALTALSGVVVAAQSAAAEGVPQRKPTDGR
jgi:hypothetical protein